MSDRSASDRLVVVLVDEDDTEVGTMEKVAAHTTPGHLHRAVSVCLFDGEGRTLLQRRAGGKYHFGGLWSNSCCTHPQPGEAPAEAAVRRVRQELGVDVAGLEHRGIVLYRAEDPASGLVEHELDHVFAGTLAGEPDPDPAEVSEVRWLAVDPETDLSGPGFTPWLPEVLAVARSGTKPS